MTTILDDHQRRTLKAICEAIHPRLKPEPSDRAPFFENSANDWPVVERIEFHLSKLTNEEILRVQSLLNRLGRTGRGWRLAGPIRAFANLDLDSRARVVQKLLRSRDRFIQAVLRSIQRLTLQGTYVGCDRRNDLNTRDLRPLYDSIGYPTGNQQVTAVERLQESPLKPGQTKLACDYLVIGSGAAGAVMAAELAETGKHVLLVDGGDLISRLEMGQSEAFAARNLFESWGAFDCGTNSVLITMAKTFGGGPMANWGTCLDPPPTLLEEWAERFGFRDTLSNEFQHSLYTVRRRLRVSADTAPVNRHNQILQDGLTQLNWQTQRLERNAVECAGCDRCEFGCASGARQDSRETYLLDAQRLGVYLLPRCRVEQLLVSEDRAVGAIARWVPAEGGNPIALEISFRNVVLAAGAIHTPEILLRSGVRGRHIGQHLHLQPAAIVTGFQSEPVRGWQGATQTIASAQFANLDGRGYGVWLEVAPVHPGLSAMFLPWSSPAHHKRLMQNLDRLSQTMVLCRDQGGGEVYVDAQGRLRILYALGNWDRLHLEEGIKGAVELQMACGSNPIFLPTWNPHASAVSPEWLDQKPWLDHKLPHSRDWKLFSAHQFSTCRIAHTAANGGADLNGRVYGYRNLFVTDASSLPTATGVNPMLTITTMSHYLSQKIKALTH